MSGRNSRGLGGDTLDVWSGHPLEAEAVSQLGALRERLSELRARVAAHNQSVEMPERGRQVVVYFGQNVIESEEEPG